MIEPFYVARGLGRIVRYAGSTEEPNTVLQHVFSGALYANSKYNDNGRLALLFLVHDAAEAICGEVPRPVKTPEQSKVEKAVLRAISEAWKIEPPNEEEARALDWLDSEIIHHEAAEYKLKDYTQKSNDLMLLRFVREIRTKFPWNITATSSDLWALYHETIKTGDANLLDFLIG